MTLSDQDIQDVRQFAEAVGPTLVRTVNPSRPVNVWADIRALCDEVLSLRSQMASMNNVKRAAPAGSETDPNG